MSASVQDAERVQEQVDDMQTKAELRRLMAEERHLEATELKAAADREWAKFAGLANCFTYAEKVLINQREQLAKNIATRPSTIEGLDAALEELRKIIRQVTDSALRNEGSFNAYAALEETSRNALMQATSHARGLVTKGERAVDVASRGEDTATAVMDSADSTDSIEINENDIALLRDSAASGEHLPCEPDDLTQTQQAQ